MRLRLRLSQLFSYLGVVALSYGSRAFQLMSNVLLARSIGAPDYASFQTVQQVVLSLFFYFSAGITYSFSSVNGEAERARPYLLVAYIVLSVLGAAAALATLTPLLAPTSRSTAILVVLSYLTYSVFGLFNAVAVRYQLFKWSAGAGFLAPLVIMATIASGFAEQASAASLALLAIIAPTISIIAHPRYGKLIITSFRPTKSAESKPALSAKFRALRSQLVHGVVLAAPVAVQSSAYSTTLTAAGYVSRTDAELLALLLPLYSLLLIGPSSLVNMLLFQRAKIDKALIVTPLIVASAAALLASPFLTNLVFRVMGSHRQITILESFLFMAFCATMVVSKVLPAFAVRQRANYRFYLLRSSAVSLFGVVACTGAFAGSFISVWLCLALIGCITMLSLLPGLRKDARHD